MPRDGSGNFTLPYPDFQPNTTIVSDEVDTNNQHIADALTQSIAKDGQTIPTANLPMGGFRLTGLGEGTAATDSATLQQVQYQDWMWAGTAGGTADALTLTPTPAIGAYQAGQAFRFLASASNTGAATVNVSSLGTKAIENDGNALAGGEIVSGKMYEIVYDGTQFQLLHVSAAPPFTGPSSSADNAIVRWDGTDGRTIQDSANGPFVDDAGRLLSHASGGALIGGIIGSVNLPPNNDLDDVTASGWHYADGSTLNVPANLGGSYAFVLTIGRSTGPYSRQLAFDWDDGKLWTRINNGGTWGSWFPILTTETSATLTGGFDATEYNAGTQSSGTFTPDPANGNFQKAGNGGAHTLAAPATTCTIVIQYTNVTGAGAITYSGFTITDGDTVTTNVGDDFLFYITKVNGFAYLNVKALQ